MTFLMISLLRNSQELQREDVATLCGWMLLLEPLTPSHSFYGNYLHVQSFSRELLHDQVPFLTRSAQNLGIGKCSNCKFLAERIKTLEARISVLEGQLEMARHPENHTLESAGILHEIYQGMRNLNME
ncbi:hypothetical protein Tco_1166127 [Tanacetum coccineum]